MSLQVYTCDYNTLLLFKPHKIKSGEQKSRDLSGHNPFDSR
jgi:hypothetical protein